MRPGVLPLVAALLFAGTAAAHDYEAGAVAIDHPYMRPSLAGVTNGAAFLVIRNRGAAADRLVAAATPVARKTELHTHIREGDVMRMRAVAAVDVPPGATVAFAPGGLHVMLIGVTRPLKAGERFPLTLTFEKAGAVAVEVAVEAAAAPAPAHRH